MEKDKVKIWIGLGSYLLASASPLALSAAETAMKSIGDGHGQSILIAQASAGGEGGAGGEAGVLAGASPDQPFLIAHRASAGAKAGEGGEGCEGGEGVILADAGVDEAFMWCLLMMKGHLRVGKELVGQDQWDDALVHFKHPVKEIYGDIAEGLSERDAGPFKAELDALSQTVKAKRGGKVLEDAYATVMTKIDGAVETLAEGTRTSPDFALSVALLLLKQAGAEYQEAVAKGKFVNVHEYQDSRGFVWTAGDLIASVSGKLRGKDAGAYRDLESLLAELKKAWPSVVPPARPVATVSEVLSNISRIERKMSGFR